MALSVPTNPAQRRKRRRELGITDLSALTPDLRKSLIRTGLLPGYRGTGDQAKNLGGLAALLRSGQVKAPTAAPKASTGSPPPGAPYAGSSRPAALERRRERQMLGVKDVRKITGDQWASLVTNYPHLFGPGAPSGQSGARTGAAMNRRAARRYAGIPDIRKVPRRRRAALHRRRIAGTPLL